MWHRIAAPQAPRRANHWERKVTRASRRATAATVNSLKRKAVPRRFSRQPEGSAGPERDLSGTSRDLSGTSRDLAGPRGTAGPGRGTWEWDLGGT